MVLFKWPLMINEFCVSPDVSRNVLWVGALKATQIESC
jgi:hypothetical protein